MKQFLLDGIQDYKLMSQRGVKQFVFPIDSLHNANWDSSIGPNGEVYFALSSELAKAEYVQFYQYDFTSNSVEQLFKAEDIIMPSDRTIRASKFHTSIGYMNDGRIVMTTHTTDRSPAHPTWMPINFYHHIWEGYPGSNIVIYDPVTKKAENLGIPVPHETIYGALYDSKYNALFFTGGYKGHLYRYSFDDKELIDFGQTSENWAFRLVFGKDGKIYGTSRSGYFYRIDPGTLKIEDLNYRMPFVTKPEYIHGDYKFLAKGVTGPDGRLYMSTYISRQFIAFDCDTDEFEELGDFIPTENYVRGETRFGVWGLDFDSEGVLWYSVWSRNCDSGRKEYGLPASLFRWDITRGGKPEWLGVVGTKDRVGSWVSEVMISDEDILYCMGSNHAFDGPEITAIDLKQFRQDMYNFGKETIEDPYHMDRDNERYKEVSDWVYEKSLISHANDWQFQNEFALTPIRLWRALAPENIENSPVKFIAWFDNQTLAGICGTNKEFVFKVVNGELVYVLPKEDCEEEYAQLLEMRPHIDLSKYEDIQLPYYPGRQYKAVPVAEAKYKGKTIVGTEDGMLAICDGTSVFSLGPAVYNGPIRSLCGAPDGSIVYGVGGDIDDIGMVFSYDESNGLRWKGHVSYHKPDPISTINCPVITSCSISPDSKILAIGSGDRLGTLVFYKV